jgi:myo-inositol-1(or 4)-monophosphatase
MAFEHESELIEAVRKAGAVLLSKWPGNPANKNSTLQQQTKSDGSIVTEADFASNTIIVEALQKYFPKDGILSEELPPDLKLQEMSRVWILDPLDGTCHFANGIDDFSILLGLAENGAGRFGIMYFPVRDKLAVGERGKQTMVNGEATRVSSSRAIRDGKVYLRYCEFSAGNKHLVSTDDLDSGAAQFALCTGELDGLVIKIKTHKEWDVAAPVVVMIGSGAKVTDERGEALRFNQGEVTFRYIVASNGLVHDELLRLVQETDRK